MLYNWRELAEMADSIRTLRDHHFSAVPISVMLILLRNLKTIEQEIRVLKETENFLKKQDLPQGEISEMEAELASAKVSVSIRKIPFSYLSDKSLSVEAMKIMEPFLEV